jgi:hypothetical protein
VTVSNVLCIALWIGVLLERGDPSFPARRIVLSEDARASERSRARVHAGRGRASEGSRHVAVRSPSTLVEGVRLAVVAQRLSV